MFSNINDGGTFDIACMKFIKFPDENGLTPVAMCGIAFQSVYGESNNLHQSPIMDRLREEILPAIEKTVGADNVCAFDTDLTCLDGLNPYGTMTDKISIPTLDFYRAHVDIFDRHRPSVWWWLATPDSCTPHHDPIYSLSVSPSGGIGDCNYYGYCGVRPMLVLKSTLFHAEGE